MFDSIKIHLVMIVNYFLCFNSMILLSTILIKIISMFILDCFSSKNFLQNLLLIMFFQHTFFVLLHFIRFVILRDFYWFLQILLILKHLINHFIILGLKYSILLTLIHTRFLRNSMR